MKIRIKSGAMSRTTTLAEFVRDNASAFTEGELRALRLALAFGRPYRGGGGAAPIFEVTRAGAALSDSFSAAVIGQIERARCHKHAAPAI